MASRLLYHWAAHEQGAALSYPCGQCDPGYNRKKAKQRCGRVTASLLTTLVQHGPLKRPRGYNSTHFNFNLFPQFIFPLWTKYFLKTAGTATSQWLASVIISSLRKDSAYGFSMVFIILGHSILWMFMTCQWTIPLAPPLFQRPNEISKISPAPHPVRRLELLRPKVAPHLNSNPEIESSDQGQILLHPWRLTWNIIMEVWKISFLSKWVICRFHVNLPGCTFVWQLYYQMTKCFEGVICSFFWWIIILVLLTTNATNGLY